MSTWAVSNEQLFCTECQTFTFFLCLFFMSNFFSWLRTYKKTNGTLLLDVEVKCLYGVFSSEGTSDSETARWIWNLFCDVLHDFNMSIQRSNCYSMFLWAPLSTAGALSSFHDIVFTQRKLPSVSHTRQQLLCNHSVCGEETSSSVAAGKLQTSSVLTTNKKYTPDKRVFAQTLILWYFCLKNLKFLLHRLALKLDFFFTFLHLNATLSNLDIFVIQNSVCSCVWRKWTSCGWSD